MTAKVKRSGDKVREARLRRFAKCRRGISVHWTKDVEYAAVRKEGRKKTVKKIHTCPE